jgi:hypothetical protein
VIWVFYTVAAALVIDGALSVLWHVCWPSMVWHACKRYARIVDAHIQAVFVLWFFLTLLLVGVLAC